MNKIGVTIHPLCWVPQNNHSSYKNVWQSAKHLNLSSFSCNQHICIVKYVSFLRVFFILFKMLFVAMCLLSLWQIAILIMRLFQWLHLFYMIVCMSVCFFHTSAKNIIFEYCLTLTSSFFFYPGSLTVFPYVCRYVLSFRCFTSFATLLFSIMAADHLIINVGYNCKN